MNMNDNNDDRRTDERINTNLPAKWDGQSGIHDARIEDISLGGCFVNTRGAVEKDEIIILSIKMPSGEWLDLRGEVTAYQPGIGFGLLFTFLTDDEESMLRQLF